MKILMVVANEGFKDEEYQVPHDYFEEMGVSVDAASPNGGEAYGVSGTALSTIPVGMANVQEYFAVAVVGGPGAKSLVGHPELESLLKKAAGQRIVVAAICYSPVVLASAGLLKGKKATVWNTDQKQGPVLLAAGAKFVDLPVVADGLTITANGPQAAGEFAREILRVAECEDCWIK